MLNNVANIEQTQGRNGFVSNVSGIVVCGECLGSSYFKAVAGGYMAIARSVREDYEAFDPSEGDDWCSDCDKDIEPRPASIPRITIAEVNAEVRAMVRERER